MQLFRVKTTVNTWANFELACLKKKERKKKEEEQFGGLATFWFVTLAMLFSNFGRLVGYKNTRIVRLGAY